MSSPAILDEDTDMATQPDTNFLEDFDAGLTIPFTQYMRPNGRAVGTSIAVSPEVHALASKLISNGLRFECEVLATGQVSLTITHPEHGDLDIRLVSNGPGVREAVEDMVVCYSKTGANL